MANPYDEVVDSWQRDSNRAPVTATTNPYDAVVGELANERQQRTRAIFEQALAVNPDQAAESKKLMNTTGLPLSVVERNLADVKRKEQARMLDLARMAQDSPVLARQLLDPSFTNQVHDHTDNLSALEQTFNVMRAVPAGAARGLGGMVAGSGELIDIGARNIGLTAVSRAVRDLTGVDPGVALDVAGSLKFAGSGWKMLADAIGPDKQAQNFATDVAGGIGQLIQQIGVQIATGGTASLVSLFSQGADVMADKTKDDKASQAMRDTAVLTGASITALTEKYGVDALLNRVPPAIKNSALRWIADKLVAGGIEATQEITEGVLQDVVRKLLTNPNATIGDGSLYEASVAGTSAAIVRAALGVRTRGAQEVREGQQAERDAAQLKAQFDLASQALLRERNPEEFRTLVQNMATQTEGAPAEVYVDAEVLNQLAPEVFNQLPQAVRDAIPEALAANTVVAIPMGDVLTIAPGTPLEAVLVDNARIGDPMAMSQVEAKAAGAKAQEFLAQEAERVIQQASDQQAMQASSDRVRQGVLDQLNAVGRFRKDVNEGYATWTAAFYTTMAGRLGVTPEEMQARYPLRVVGQGGQGAVLNAPGTAPVVALAGREIPITLGRQDQRAGFNLVPVDTAAFDAAFKAADDEFRAESYVGPGGTGAAIGDRYQRFGEFAATAPSVEAPTVSVDANGRVTFGNGRHRFAYMRDNGVAQIPVAMDEESYANAVAAGLVPDGQVFNQAAKKQKPGPDAPGAGLEEGNKLGFWPALRVKLTGKLKLPEKAPILTGTTNKNAARQIAAIDGILKKFPKATESTAEWTKMMAYALGSTEVPVPPYAFIRDLNGTGSLDKLRTLTQGQIDDASHGFENAAEFRRAYIAGELGVETTGKLFMWSFLSRGVSPYTQEALFIDAFDGADKWIAMAARGEFTEAVFPEYEAWAKSVAPKGSGQPGAGATHNLNAFGQDFLFKMSRTGEDGKTHMQRLHDMMADPAQTGKNIRREFATFGEGVGIDNKVVSFTLLVAGFNDVMVLDRVQIRQLWDDGRFNGTNLYDGSSGPDGKKLAGSSLNSLAEGARGILVYEAIERGLEAKIQQMYTDLGRPQDASIGRYHWETWVADSQQEASHGTLGAILADAKGDDQAIANVSAKQGEYGAYEYGALYNRDTDGTPWFGYETPTGGKFAFSVPAFRAFLEDIKRSSTGVVPTKFKVTESGNAPWYTRPEVDQAKLDERARYWADRAGGSGEGQRAVEEALQQQTANRARPGAADQPEGGDVNGRLEQGGDRAGRQEGRDLAPLAGAPSVPGFQGPDPRIVAVAEQYARDNGIDLKRQADYVQVDPERAARIAAAYEAMQHAPQDPAVREAYQNLINQTLAQYRALEAAGYKFWFINLNNPANAEYASTPWNAMRDMRANQQMGVFPTNDGFGSGTDFSPEANPLLADTGLQWPVGGPDGPLQPVLANDLFRAVRDAFGHGMEGAGFRAQGEENAWQAHVRLFTGTAVGAITSETRGQNSWLNFGPNGESNRTAQVEDTVFADQKTGLMPEWTWSEGRAGDMAADTLAQGPRGTFNPKNLELALNENADLSTFLHETGHFFLEVMADLASQPGAPADIQADMAALMKWFGVADLATWNSYTLDEKRPYHERFAESFEQYLMEGEAPSLELQPLFRKFRAWMLNVYKSLKAFIAGNPDSGIELSDEIRQVFDRMVASEEQIAQANEVAGLLPNEEADAEANEKLTARSLRDLKWTVNARAREIKKLQKQAATLRKEVEAEVALEVNAMPEFQAKEMLDATRKENKQQLNDTELAIIADSFGYASAEDMLRAIDAAGKKADLIEGMTDQRMLERHGDLIDQRAIEQAANEAVHNEARARSLATELRSQAEMLNPRTDTGQVNAKGSKITVNALMEAAKQFAANVIARTPLRDLKAKAWQHTAAERRANKRWQEATAKGQTQEAVKAKQDQVLNNAAAKAAMDAQAEMRKILEFFRRVVKDGNEKTVEKGRDPDVVNAARAILGAYGVAPKGAKTALEYMALVEKNDPAMYAALQPSMQGALNMAQPLDALTMEELRGLHEEIQAMWHLAKRSRQMEIDGNLIDMDDAEAELQDRMQLIGVPATMPGDTGAVTPREELARKLQFVRSILRRVEQWAQGMGSEFTRLVFQPVKDAADAYRADRIKYRKKYQALVDAVAPALDKGLIEAPELNYTFGNGHNGIGHAELVHAILHTGNESNKRKLLLGRNWATENADGTLNTARWDSFLQRMHDTGVLNKAHYDFAQGVWDLLEETKPLAQKTHRDVFGRYFAEVTADSFETPFGSYRGGYVPAQADPRIVQDADLRKLAEAENENMSFSFPGTNKGFTKGRVEYNRPLMLDLRTIGQHIDKVLLFSHMEPAVRDVQKLLSRKGVSYSLGRIDPTIYAGMLTPWLNRSARQVVETPAVGDGGISRVLTAARSRAGMALMFANISNTIQQLTGFSLAALKVKPSSMMAATAQFIANPKQTAKAVSGASAFMADRMENEIASINEAMNDILLAPSKYERMQAWTQRHAYFLQTAMANTMEPIIWTAAYNDAIADGQSERDAVRAADSVIRTTQGSTLPEDVSRIETGPAYARMVTQFIGYFNMMANTNATALKQLARETGLRKGAGKAVGIVTMGMLIPIWVAEAIAQAMRGGPDDEDKDGYLDDWLAAVFGMGTIKGAFAMVPFVGQLANAGVARFNDNPADDKVSLSPAVSLLEAAVGVPVDVYKAITEPEKLNLRNAVRDVASAVSIATGLPAYALARPLGYLAGVEQGKIEPTDTADLVRGVLTGTPSPASK